MNYSEKYDKLVDECSKLPSVFGEQNRGYKTNVHHPGEDCQCTAFTVYFEHKLGWNR